MVFYLDSTIVYLTFSRFLIKVLVEAIRVSPFDCCAATNTLKEHGWLFNFIFALVSATLD